jgi:transcriptional regulator with XRE-family HTH domain
MNFYTDEIDYSVIGQKIKQKRSELGMSQEELAEACDISPSYIGHLERASRNLSLNTAIKLSQVLNISLDYLLVDALPTESAVINSICSEIKNHNPTQIKKFMNTIKILADNIDKL